MLGRKLAKAVLAATAAATVAACAATSLQSTWKNPAAEPLSLKGKKVVALVVVDEEGLRNSAEDEAAREITEHGGVGVPAYTLLPQAEIRDKERARTSFEAAGVEAVVVLRPVAKERALAGSFSGIPYSGSLWGPGFWGGGPGWGSGYLRTDLILVVETLVYSLQRNQLVWASQSQTMNPTEVGAFVRELGKTVGTQMEKQGLL